MAVSADIASLVARELSFLKQFTALLANEQDALVKGDIDGLPALAERKNRLIEELSGLAGERERALRALSLPAGREGMDAWAKTGGGKDWNALLTLAREARGLNDINGKLVSERLRHNQKALQVLTAASERAALYGPDGQPRVGSGGGRTLGSA